MKFASYLPRTYKKNLILTLLNRAYEICSNFELLHTEIEFLKLFFLKNEFTSKFIDPLIRKFINIKYKPKFNVTTVPRKLIYITLPFYGPDSIILKKKLSKLLSKFYPQINLQCLFKNNCTIGSYFKFKDKLPEEMCSSLIYQYNCDECNSSYIGKTIRQLKVRIYEHKGFSLRTGLVLNSPMNSSIRDHALNQNHPIKNSYFKILTKSKQIDLYTLETLHIFERKPNLNEMNCLHNLRILG